jgi:hypothetical protein
MIHHVSISAHRPQHVAEVLAEIMHGHCHPFPGQIADSFMAVTGDDHGTMVEVYPEDTTLNPGVADDEQVTGLRGQAAPATVPFHFLLSVPASAGEIERIGAREGWRTRLFGRGPRGQKPFFHVIEFWVENRLMIELAPETMIGEYTDIMGSSAYEGRVGRATAH